MAIIEAFNLDKTFELALKKPGMGALISNLFYPEKRLVPAVSKLSLRVEKGETLAFIGPNGAGKSTTIKMLTGILHPSSGTARVAGCVPWEERSRLAYQIGCVFGQRSQLWYHLPVGDTFDVLAAIFDIEEKEKEKRPHIH